MSAPLLALPSPPPRPRHQRSRRHTLQGIELTIAAFSSNIGVVGAYIVSIGIILFAFSTILGWEYHGEKAWEYLFGTKSILFYRVLFLVILASAAFLKLESIWHSQISSTASWPSRTLLPSWASQASSSQKPRNTSNTSKSATPNSKPTKQEESERDKKRNRINRDVEPKQFRIFLWKLASSDVLGADFPERRQHSPSQSAANTRLPRRGRCRPQILMPADRVDYQQPKAGLLVFFESKRGLRVLTLLRKEKSCYQKASANFIFFATFF